MDNDRAFKGRLSDQTAYPFAAIVVLALAAVIGAGLLPGRSDRPSTRTAEAEMPSASSPSSSADDAARAPAPSLVTARGVDPVERLPLAAALGGLIGLPEPGMKPSQPEVGELLDSYPVAGGRVPYRGMARLYADGRLIWNMYYSGPAGSNAYTTGYLEQRVTPEGAELIRSRWSLQAKDPLRIPDWLPQDAWRDRTLRPFIPSGYGVCLNWMNPRQGMVDGRRPHPEQFLNVLPESVSSLVRDHKIIDAADYEMDCVAQTVDEARQLDQALSDSGSKRDAFVNRFLTQHSLDVSAGMGTQVWFVFEPRFPDGSIGCSACG